MGPFGPRYRWRNVFNVSSGDEVDRAGGWAAEGATHTAKATTWKQYLKARFVFKVAVAGSTRQY